MEMGVWRGVCGERCGAGCVERGVESEVCGEGCGKEWSRKCVERAVWRGVG